MKTDRHRCSRHTGGFVPVLLNSGDLYSAPCQAVETMTVGTSAFRLTVINPTPPGSSLYWLDDDLNFLTEDGELILWSV